MRYWNFTLRTAALVLILTIIFATSVSVSFAKERHAGGSAADVASIKKAVAKVRYPVTDWFIAIRGSNAVVQFAEGPAAGGTAAAVRPHGRWTVTCIGNEKRLATECGMPASVFANLSAETNRLMSRP